MKGTLHATLTGAGGMNKLIYRGSVNYATDFDSCLEAGLYSFVPGALHSPKTEYPDVGDFGAMIAILDKGPVKVDDNWLWQIVFTTSSQVLFRQKINKEPFGAWKRIV